MIEPPPSDRRRQPLPEQRPKASADDPEAPAKLASIINNPGYVLAERDIDFLARPDMRGFRLMLDYLKPQRLLDELNVEHTVVVFGSTRIPERAAAQRTCDTLQVELATRPDDVDLVQRCNTAQRVLAKAHYYDTAREFGRLVGTCGDRAIGGRLMIVTGGGPGIMEAANRGAHDAGARSIGLNIDLPLEQFPNPYVTPELCFRFHYFAMRKLHLLLRARALVAFPGGYGTMDELFEVLTLSQTRKIPPVPIVLIGEEYWRQVVNLDFLVDEGTIDPEDRELFWFAESAPDIWRGILRWYEAKDQPLLPPDAVPAACR